MHSVNKQWSSVLLLLLSVTAGFTRPLRSPYNYHSDHFTVKGAMHSLLERAILQVLYDVLPDGKTE